MRDPVQWPPHLLAAAQQDSPVVCRESVFALVPSEDGGGCQAKRGSQAFQFVSGCLSILKIDFVIFNGGEWKHQTREEQLTHSQPTGRTDNKEDILDGSLKEKRKPRHTDWEKPPNSFVLRVSQAPHGLLLWSAGCCWGLGGKGNSLGYGILREFTQIGEYPEQTERKGKKLGKSVV